MYQQVQTTVLVSEYMSKTCTGHFGLYCITKLQVRIFKSNCIFVLPSNRSDSVCIGSAIRHYFSHMTAYTMVPSNKRQPVSISGHIFYASRVCSGATEHGELQTRSRRSRRAITWPLATSVMNARTSSPQCRRTRTPLNHVSQWRKGFRS